MVKAAVQKVRQPPPVVIKLGGSLSENDRIGGMLDIVARASRRAVIVPGGGPFADTVRQSQEDLNFSDEAAHHMAILAMHQYAEVLMDLQPRLTGAESIAAIRAVWREGKLPIWLPLKMCSGDGQIPADWSITSDGLAARLAERMRCSTLILVKSRRVDCGLTATQLARQGIVDTAFPRIAKRAGLTWSIIGPGQEIALANQLGSVRIIKAKSTQRTRRSQRRKPRSRSAAV